MKCFYGNHLLFGISGKKGAKHINQSKPPVNNKRLGWGGFWHTNSSGGISNEISHRPMFGGIPADLLSLELSFLNKEIFEGGEVRIAGLSAHKDISSFIYMFVAKNTEKSSPKGFWCPSPLSSHTAATQPPSWQAYSVYVQTNIIKKLL